MTKEEQHTRALIMWARIEPTVRKVLRVVTWPITVAFIPVVWLRCKCGYHSGEWGDVSVYGLQRRVCKWCEHPEYKSANLGTD